MAKFKMVNDDPQEVEFEAYIDHDGDFVVLANGEELFFIDRSAGKLELFSVYGDIPGLDLVDDCHGFGGKVIRVRDVE